MTLIRAFLAFEAIAFAAASLIHRGLLVPGYSDEGASTAEGVIGLVLFIGPLGSFVWPERTRLFGLVAQGFGILGTSVGLFLLTRGLAQRRRAAGDRSAERRGKPSSRDA